MKHNEIKIKLIFSSQFVAHFETIVIIQDNINMTDKKIKMLFKALLDIDYDDNCSYGILT